MARLVERLGSVLSYLQEMHGSIIEVPRNAAARPDPERLEIRYEQFKAAS